MDDHIVILIIALLVLLYGYISKALSRFNISGPMMFTCFGILISPLGFNITQVEVDAGFVKIIVEIALVLVLFADAALLDFKLLKQSWKIPARLLFIGLPITIVAGTFVATLIFPDEPVTYLLLLALLLTPTDAALGKAVVTDPKVPERIRLSINVESGLNDGIVFPIVLTVVAMILSGLTETQNNDWMGYVVEQIVFGALVGGAVGYLGTKFTMKAVERRWMELNYENLIPIALAILSFYLAESFGGNGFIAAFFAGLYAGNTSETTRQHIEGFTETEGELFVLVSFFLFGLVFVPITLPYITFDVVLYAFLSLTVLRMLPVMISLIGAKLDLATMAFIAWFGPRGIASILYVLIVVHDMGTMQGLETIYAIVTLTVLMSILAHGLTAQPFANLYVKSHKE
ncbi:sodium:proton antiporter [Shewanella sp. D64]|uniref:cation:proton antiporter n=1 Tax=unclassified Shewanella TaxID=196818 RepID=UPI0022BA2E1E|nr:MULTISPECIES: sodium:proton antiporter [unclassified Shewanella]MEC4725600.1 sodium:proton antiporter [Shewanella sp. D64]MEC4739652.1 sodium:proton antiporter [Shewanella sp. E94]WBJ94882.1 sodium:proton antiporter [Shewanella sp. MTB7]